MEQTPESPLASGPAPENASPSSLTSAQSLFASPPPSVLVAPGAVTSVVAPPVQSSPVKWIVSLGIGLVIIAVIAWVWQYLPSRGVKQDPVKGDKAKPVLHFADETGSQGLVTAVWRHDLVENHVKEFEFGTSGHYDFVFDNISDGAAEIGIFESSCKCSRIEICLLDEQQRAACQKAIAAGKPPLELTSNIACQQMEVDRTMQKAVTVPRGGSGVLRLHWKSPAEGDPEQEASHLLHLTVKVWSRAPGQGRNRAVNMLEAKAFYVRAALFFPEVLDLGLLGPREETAPRSFTCWSATRQLEVEPASEDKRLKIEVTPLSRWRCAELALRLRANVCCAFRVTVTLAEQADGKQLDLGPIRKPVPVKITSGGVHVTFKTPLLRASVRGVVRLALQEEEGKVSLKPFPVTRGTTKTVFLLAPPGFTVLFDDRQQELSGVTAQLEQKETVDGETRWQMTVTVVPKSKSDAGQLPENAVLVLRVELSKERWRPAVVGMLGVAATGPAETLYQSRLVRIPITGTAESR